ncbi:hypothetical protein [Legionella jamestowniensis]|uniref:hypothetical protein n=1 Tax=Legionella jamestowniensis TaxID=455 RepID=UPI0008ED8AFA|nr:hypothetical protein [Legionella jamestowniensis]SFM07698.1 hypothetical protein SAMN02746073_0274 [Legionella jamestowniensis DSM 19215]
MSNSKSSFSRPPLTPEEKIIKEKEFLSFDKTKNEQTKIIKKREKEPVKSIFLRAPESFLNDIHEIVNITGLSMNAVCLELLRPAIKRKLKELKEEM